MKDTEKKPLFTELTAKESATVNGAHGYDHYPCGSRRVSYSYHHRPYYNYQAYTYPSVTVKVSY
jgi:hypothetical protein